MNDKFEQNREEYLEMLECILEAAKVKKEMDVIMNAIEVQCSNRICRFCFYRSEWMEEKTFKGQSGDYAECLRNPPTHKGFPLVHVDHTWCGEFRGDRSKID